MNSFKLQFNYLIIKILIVLLIGVCTNLSKVIAQQITDIEYANVLYDSAKVHYRNANYSDAIEYFNKILLLKRKIPQDIKPEYFKVYNWLGLIYKKQGNLQKAIKYYQLAVENTTDNYYISLINDNLANVYSLTGDYLKAIYYYENTLSILEKSDEKTKYQYVVNNYHNVGFAYKKLGNYNLAKDNYLKSIQISKENQLGENGDTHYNCGLVYQKLDSLEKADYYLKKAIDCYIRDFGENHYMTAMAYVNYAIFYSEIGNFSKSELFYQKAYKILINTLGEKHPYTSLCLQNLGQLYYKKKNYRQALNYYQESLISKIYDFNDSSIYINPKPSVFPDLDLLDILKLKAQALKKLSEFENKELNLKVALSTLELTVSFIEQLRTGYLYESSKLQIAAQEHETYLSIISIANSLYEIFGDIKYAELAFKYAELSKYAVLRELKNEEMARDIAEIPDSISNNERKIKEQVSSIRMQVEEENRLEIPDRSKIDKWNKELFQLTQQFEKIVKEVEQNYKEYFKRKYDNSVISINKLQSELSEKEVFIEYVLSDKKLFTFIVTRQNFEFISQQIDSSFTESLQFYINFLRSEYIMSYDDFRISAYRLYEYLIAPVEDYISGKNLLIVPDGELSLIAFESLVDEPFVETESADYRKEPYLIKKYPIGYSFSATLFVNSKKHKKQNKRFLAFAPDYKNSKDSLPELPSSLKNLKKIKRFLRGKIFAETDANEANFKENYQNFGIIHFYTHGYEDSLNPALSKMFFSHNNDTIEDGYLYAYEVNNLKMKPELVVLASCYSGSGNILSGEGTMSMGRSFLNAGSSSIIMSLWIAYYKPSLFELKEFYKYLLRGKRKDEALRLAKLHYLESANPLTASPKYWTSLISIGNQDPLFKGYVWKILILPTSILLIILTLLVIWKRKRSK